MWKRLLAIVLIAVWALVWWSNRSVRREPGVMVSELPVQESLASVKQFIHQDHKITPLARFALEARVLGVKRYYLDREARLAPYDLALGWGRMSDSAVLDKIQVSQSGRFFHWSTELFPIPRGEVVSCSANMHIIPADLTVKSKLQRVREGHIVSLKGFLVMAENKEGNVWLSSLTRTDAGNGACELFWVEDLDYR